MPESPRPLPLAPAVPRRARELGLGIGDLPTGTHNAITDVPGIRVGHTTLIRPPHVHSGVTAIVPEGVGPASPLPAGVFAGNGYGKLVGTTQIAELGALETPVLLTSTLSAFRVADALVGWVLEQPEGADARSVNPVVGECNDGLLSDIRSRPVREEHVRAALDSASAGPVAEGSVGAGTGTTALGFKSGIGTSSRRVPLAGRETTLGVLVQANFAGTLRVRGRTVTPVDVGVPAEDSDPVPETGSCMIVVATEAPWTPANSADSPAAPSTRWPGSVRATAMAAATTASRSALVRWARPPDPRWCPMPGSTFSSARCWTPWKRRFSTHC